MTEKKNLGQKNLGQTAPKPKLKQKYGISGILALVVVKVGGTVVTKDGRSHVSVKSPAQAVEEITGRAR